ncbi:hypothetical protein LSCM4_00532 [Leishmania orientalis]|uniref:START domain-containing protein n=1 Tax=Leishmania orientalis TaxID=2249476 RepID=A0A836KBU0_9TRYP|nr:hypothetical protein LSCM4_00532 [Leishmania orientalis]
MLISSDGDLLAAVPVLKPLLALAEISPVSWKQLSSRDGYTVSEIPPMPALGLPIKSYRTQFVVNADLAYFQRVISDEASIREYDPNLKDLRTLERRACTSLLYTSYVSPSPWLIAPRDFCVRCASVFTTPQQLMRVLADTDEGSDQLSNRSLTPNACCWAWQGSEGTPDPSQTLYLQSSMTALESDCGAVPTPLNRGRFVRGIVYCFGYVAFADPSIEGKLRVTNYCCVDPAGQLPQWLVAAAVDENTKKLRKIAALVEAAAAATPAAAQILTCPSALSAQPSSAKQQQEPQLSAASNPNASSDEANEEGFPTPLRAEVHCREALLLALPKAGGPSANETYPLTQADGDTDPLMPPASASFSSAPHSARKERRSSPPPSATREGTPAYHHTATSVPPRLPNAAANVNRKLELLSLLARANGWRTCRETGEVQYAELHALPEPLRSTDPLCVAMRVSTSVRCNLDTFAAILRNPALFPEIDPELVRVVSASTSPGGSGRAASQESSTSANGALPAATASRQASMLLSGTRRNATVDQVRHYQFDASDSFRYPWDMVLHCSDVELTQLDGGRYGFHTPEVAAATYVWAAEENTTLFYRGAHPDSYHRHMQVRVFGITAVAVPRCADTVRVSQYMLFEAGAPAPPIRQNRWHLSFQKKSPKKEFLPCVSSWMETRMKRLRRLCEDQQRRLNRSAMMALDKMPLLHFVYQVHCAEGGCLLESPETALHGDVLARSIPWAGGGSSQRLRVGGVSGEPPLLVLSTVFPCSLAKLRDYMLFNPPRCRYALESGIHAYEEFPSPPGFTTVRVEYGAASATFPQVRLTLLEAFGEVGGANASSPTLVLSRAGVGGDVGTASEELDTMDECSGVLHSGADDRFEDGRVFCYGWVASKLEGNASQTSANGSSEARERPNSGRVAVSPGLRRMLPTSEGKCEDPAVLSPECIKVTQYLSVGLPLSRQGHLDANGLPHGCMAEQAAFLQRFRDAVCSRDPNEGTSSR